ncbi:hypothetical protein I316_04378 [Kwoniella heveanensis BCC8398]|uniref:Uncharacterized protein n=1 Tax=Kwoniella heveanensis BCC8398 TaxID=1296120 RepID=A0A1B9GSH9_9TREE|nr:hypothetical protein I316_04378 [Kwoniella heveanensis BCC8398]
MLPSIVSTILPIPSLILLLTLTLYHLTPLLTLLPNLTPSLHKLSTIIPHPRKARNLPREFFNLPPRPNSPSYNDASSATKFDNSIRGRMGVRGGLMLILVAEALVSLGCGWAGYPALSSSEIQNAASSSWGLISASVSILPTTIAWLSIFTISARPAMFDRHASHTTSKLRTQLLRGGGITHRTLFPRILPLSVFCPLLAIVPSAILTSSNSLVILAYTSLCLAVIVGSAGIGMWRMVHTPREGQIRLRGESRMSLYEKEGLRGLSPETDSFRVSGDMREEEALERMREGTSWVSSPSRPPTPVSSFAYSPDQSEANTSGTTNTDSFKTPKSKPSNSPFAASASFAAHHSGTESKHGPSANVTSIYGSATTLVSPDHSQGEAAEGVMNDQSWLSEPTNTPSSISAWSFPPTPEPAITRARSPSPSTLPLSPTEDGRDPNLPRPGQKRINQIKASDTTTYTHTSSGTPGGSVLADYSPDPFRPMPRAFESLTSYPISPSGLESKISLATRSAALRSGETLACVPVQKVNYRGSSTWTLQTYHSPSHGQTGTNAHDKDPFKTPDLRATRARKALSTDRRAPPPPPMPVDMPLPPTPTLARSSTLFDLNGDSAKGSMELLMGGPEKDWVEVEWEEDALEDWGRGGRGVGVLAVVGTFVCFALSLPLLLSASITSMGATLYLISLLLPSPILALTSYLLRYRPVLTTSFGRSKKGSTTHRSLALRSESQLSLPLSISPKLTPPAPKRASTLNFSSPTLTKMIEPKPSLTTFLGSTKSPERRHTVYGGLTIKDMEAEEAMRKTLARRSGDVWISSGHAIEGGGLLSRATEMLKPVPAMRVLDNQPRVRETGALRALRGGIVSMLANRTSRLFESEIRGVQEQYDMGQFEDAEAVTASPARSGIAISIIAPSPDKRVSRARSQSISSIGDGEVSWQTESAHITVAKRGRMSNGPTFIFGKGGHDDGQIHGVEGYDLDWMTAGVLPNLVPGIKIGSDVRVGPIPTASAAPSSSYPPQTHASGGRPITSTTDHGATQDAEEGESSYVTMPSFHAASLKEQSTPHTSRHKGKHMHTRSYSSSIDLSRSPEYYTAETATSASRELRQRNFGSIGLSRSDTAETRNTVQHKPSFGLPKIDNDDFEGDMRKSFDDLHRPDYRALMEKDNQPFAQSGGIDLPPIPSSLTHRPSLSRVSERTEEPTLSLSTSSAHHSRSHNQEEHKDGENSAILSQTALEDMHLALALSTSPASSRAKSSDHSADVSFAPSVSLNEEVLEEMERMMAMDTPTRAEFVISPPPSAVGGGSDGRASRASERSLSISSVSTSVTGYTVTTTTTSHSHEDSPAPPVPALPREYRQPAYPVPIYSHPHPPPLTQAIFPQPSRNQLPPHMPANVQGPHPPMQSFLPMRSTETLHSTSSSTASAGPTPKSIKLRRSRGELKLVAMLNERNELRAQAQSHPPIQSQAKTLGKKKTERPTDLATKRGLRPLSLVADKQANRSSIAGAAVTQSKGGKAGGNKRISILEDDEAVGPNGMVRARRSNGPGSNKENTKRGSKTSTGSGVVGVRGLRA